MGKGNLFLGYGRGKVGDIVFSRSNGNQVFRARNRNPRNPRTNKQLVQRAIMATIMHAYSAGREIFDHSFQGYSVGEGCQRRFMTLNLNALRSQLSVDFDNAVPEEALAKVTAPGIATVVPNPYVISEGTMVNNLFALDSEFEPVWSLPQANEGETIAQYADRVGIVAGDIYTWVYSIALKGNDNILFELRPNMSTSVETVYRGLFGWVRFICKDVAGEQQVVTSNTPISTFFEFESSYPNPVVTSNTLEQIIGISRFLPSTLSEDTGYAIGLIKSRRDVDLRSNSSMIIYSPEEFGLYWEPLLEAWKRGTTPIGSSDLILEGGDE